MTASWHVVAKFPPKDYQNKVLSKYISGILCVYVTGPTYTTLNGVWTIGIGVGLTKKDAKD